MPTTLYLPLGTAGLTGLTARTLSGGTLSSPATLSEVAGTSGLYEGAIADSFEIALVFDGAGTLIAEAAYGGGFTPEDRTTLVAIPTAIATLPSLAQVQAVGFTTDRNNALELIDLRVQEMYQRQGLDEGVTATVVDPTVTTPGSLTVREGSTVLISQTLTKPDEDTVTISRNA